MIQSQYTSRLLEQHQFQGQSNDCGPYCASMILNSFTNYRMPANILASELNRIHWKGIWPVFYRIPNWATFPWSVARLLKDSGLNARWKIFTNPDYLLANLQTLVFIVLLGNYLPLWAHYKILTAFDPYRGWGFVDPGDRKPGISWQNNTDFICHWNKFGGSIVEVKPER
jgi:hypothetical protein